MHFSFDGKTVIVAGAHGGIGRRVAELFAECGSTVHACDIIADGLATAFADVRAGAAGQVCTGALDLRDADAVAEFVRHVEESAADRRVDIVVYAAGGVCSQVAQPFEEVSKDDFLAVFDANLLGLYNLLHGVLPAMKKARAGRILTISSRAGLGTSRTGIQSYTMAKAGQIGLVRQLAQELGRYGITVNSIAPGFMRTNESSEKQWESYGPEGQAQVIESIALRRLGTPDDIAYAALFLSSPYASWITGQTLAIGGSP